MLSLNVGKGLQSAQLLGYALELAGRVDDAGHRRAAEVDQRVQVLRAPNRVARPPAGASGARPRPSAWPRAPCRRAHGPRAPARRSSAPPARQGAGRLGSVPAPPRGSRPRRRRRGRSARATRPGAAAHRRARSAGRRSARGRAAPARDRDRRPSPPTARRRGRRARRGRASPAVRRARSGGRSPRAPPRIARAAPSTPARRLVVWSASTGNGDGAHRAAVGQRDRALGVAERDRDARRVRPPAIGEVGPAGGLAQPRRRRRTPPPPRAGAPPRSARTPRPCAGGGARNGGALEVEPERRQLGERRAHLPSSRRS